MKETRFSVFPACVAFGALLCQVFLAPALSLASNCGALAANTVRNLNSLSQTTTLPRPNCTPPKPSPEERIHNLIQEAICAKNIEPTAEVVIGDAEGVWMDYRSRPKDRRLFDMASITKPVATAASIMKLVDDGKLKLSDRLGAFFTKHGIKGFENSQITISDLLRHRSGLDEIDAKLLKSALPSLPGDPKHSRNEIARSGLEKLGAKSSPLPRKTPLYRDSNYFVLGEIVRFASGMPLQEYATTHVFKPAGMTSTRFAKNSREVADPLAKALHGQSGHSGLFSNGQDMAKFAQMILNDGKTLEGAMVLSSRQVQEMTTSLPSDERRRFIDAEKMGGIEKARTEMHAGGFDMNPSILRGAGCSLKSFGHAGSTGTSILIDPEKKVYVVLLSQTLRDGAPSRMNALRKAIATEGMALVEARKAAQACAQTEAQTHAAKDPVKRVNSFTQWISETFEASGEASGEKSGKASDKAPESSRAGH
ncbi:MAG TPA: serine hydrolase [Bdellovibrionota bacterium]|nr:serine hydrolase [Bdellovibrionota bacterium]